MLDPALLASEPVNKRWVASCFSRPGANVKIASAFSLRQKLSCVIRTRSFCAPECARDPRGKSDTIHTTRTYEICREESKEYMVRKAVDYQLCIGADSAVLVSAEMNEHNQ